MNVVLDTNVIISAAIRPDGNSALIINAIANNDDFQLYYSADILAEYNEVLARERFGFDESTRQSSINRIVKIGELIEPTVSTTPIPDETDRKFYDAAKEAGATLVTGNIDDFPEEDFIITPRRFLDGLKESNDDTSD